MVFESESAKKAAVDAVPLAVGGLGWDGLGGLGC